MAMIFVPLPYTQYVKKEDVLDYFKLHFRRVAIIFTGFAISLSIFRYFVIPKLLDLYASFGIPLPPSAMIMITSLPLIVAALGFGAFHFFTKEPDKTYVQDLLAKYKDGEMINVQTLPTAQFDMWVFLAIGLVVAITVVGIIMPVYRLTDSM